MAGKKSKEGKGKKQQSAKPPASRQALEKQLIDVGKLLEEQQFETLEEANAFLNVLLSGGQGIPSGPPTTPLEEAQELMYEAFEAHGRRRIKLARKALQISEDCADAYVLLAEEAARSAEEALELYEKGVRAAERALGAKKMADYEGHFWGFTETRPYMRARAGLAGALWALNRRDEAIEVNDMNLWQETPGALAWLSRHVSKEGAVDAEGEQWIADFEEAVPEGKLPSLFGDELEPDYAPFELDEWLNALEIPRKEHAAIRRLF